MNLCATCKHWKKITHYECVANTGECLKLFKSDKITIDLCLGWDGGYVRGLETDEDFGCVLYENKEDNNGENKV